MPSPATGYAQIGVRNLPPEFMLVLGMVFLIVGFVFAFAGNRTWHILMVVVGALIGGLLGVFAAFYYFNSPWAALAGGLIGSMIGSKLFGYVAETAVPFAFALLIFIIGFIIARPRTATTFDAILIAGAAAFVILVLGIFIVEQLIALLTAAIGALLSMFGVVFIGAYYGHDWSREGLILAGVLFLTGLISQFWMQADEKEARAALVMRRQSVRTTVVAPAAPGPAPPPNAPR
ncbi:MAG TPA: hypothetical protein VI893_09115 [Thermoplasmata archaeon]|nr:hypothetical protein [Thermoplasmata archaeon]